MKQVATRRTKVYFNQGGGRGVFILGMDSFLALVTATVTRVKWRRMAGVDIRDIGGRISCGDAPAVLTAAAVGQ